ncbi:multidrug efflux pump subunit AcrB [Hydrogenispora ethanolica]|uniref:Multidrug efflux pump subunit AcrB n=1 Tax=Hydrogenispora ethanolica TaxID=1082276 RepID=A0A4R1R310_HYDET|nr:efflux RND transporter permease subunit [Hydrogenispora ethanolica]TCL59775.1 multidrug efflux pump subunit AcrB [Hydrogenispora ethanolica]
MNRFNLTEWTLDHKPLVSFFIILIFAMGVFSYQGMGRMEDPDFTIRQMIVAVAWPGASARQIEEQVTDKIEQKLQDTPGLDYLKSYSRPGQSVIYVVLKDTVVEKDVRPTWLEVRNMVNDIKANLPAGTAGPFFNDRFDDVFGSIYAITSDGYTYEEMREQAERIRRMLLGVKDVKKVQLLGVQPEKIYIEMESSKLAQLGIDPNYIMGMIQTQNAMTPSGMIETRSDNVYLRISGMFEDIADIRNLPIRAAGGTFRLSEIATVNRSYADPPEPEMFYNGRPVIGIALSMAKGGNILTMGRNLSQTVVGIKKDLPAGMELLQVADQPKVVKESINEFVETLLLAVVIVLLVCFLSLGLRTGIVVALGIPLVIAGVFFAMKTAGIDLHKISLGALIIALGLLVDDAIIVVESMIVKLEQGWDRTKAACFAYTSTAYPRLTGALITCAGFIPIGFSLGSASEFIGSIFTVVTMALVISWVVAGTATPLLGYRLINIKPAAAGKNHDLYDTPFYRSFKRMLSWCLNHRKFVLGLTVAGFIGSVFIMSLLKQEFFPASTRPELIVDLKLPEGASLKATEAVAKRFAKSLHGDPNVINYTAYVGQGAPRFLLTADPVLPSSDVAQFVIMTKGTEARNTLSERLNRVLKEQFPEVRGHLRVLQLGPPDPYPVTLRVTGYAHDKVREIVARACAIMSANPKLRDINLDWNEKSKTMRLEIDQDKARLLGVNSQGLAITLQSQLSGIPVTEFRENDKTVSIVFRMDIRDRNNLSQVKDLNVPLGDGRFVPLDQIAKIRYDAEDGLIWRRNLKPTITIQADTVPGVSGVDASKEAYAALQELRRSLPPGYSIEVGGMVERMNQAIDYLMQPVPLMIVAITLLLMVQLQSIPKMILTLLTAPLGLIGASLALLLTGRPVGFVVYMGILALAGIIIRNTVILIDQIEQQLRQGESVWNAIVTATILRFRPIMLTAVAAILGMIPLATSALWGPMAIAIAGGLLMATVLTLLVFPTMYAAWYRVKPGREAGYSQTLKL